jgi:hypothetical protein
MSKHYYDDDDYEFDGIDSVDEGEFFGDMDEETVAFDIQMAEFEAEFNTLIAQAEGDLAAAIEEGNLSLADRLQDEIELIMMTDFSLKEMR